MLTNALHLQEYVGKYYCDNKSVDHEAIAKEFHSDLKGLTEKDFIDLLIVSGFIPDIYDHDSSQETLFSKLTEVLVAEWAIRLGFRSEYIKEKSSKEDVDIWIGDKIVVADAKSYRLGRSQAAPNTKDFIKPEDIRKWMGNHQNAIGGLVTYPCRHEWAHSSDAFLYCTTKETPTVMLPYKYLAYVLKYKESFDENNILSLWEYKDLFPKKLSKDMKGGNRKAYWEVMDREIVRVTNTEDKVLEGFMLDAEEKIRDAVRKNIEELENIIEQTKSKVQTEILKLRSDELVRQYTEFKTLKETEEVIRIVNNVKRFRM